MKKWITDTYETYLYVTLNEDSCTPTTKHLLVAVGDVLGVNAMKPVCELVNLFNHSVYLKLS